MPPTVPGTTTLTKAEDWLVASLQASATLSGMSGHVYVDEFPDPTNPDEYAQGEFTGLFPAAMVYEPAEGGIDYNHISDGAHFGYTHTIRLNVEVQKERGNGTNQNEARTFKNEVTGILEDILAQSGERGKFAVSFATKTQAQWLEPDSVSGNQRMAAILELTFSSEGD